LLDISRKNPETPLVFQYKKSPPRIMYMATLMLPSFKHPPLQKFKTTSSKRNPQTKISKKIEEKQMRHKREYYVNPIKYQTRIRN